MAKLERPKRTRWVDAGGRVVRAGTPGAVKKLVRSKIWYARGVPGHPERVPLGEDRRRAEAMFAEMVLGAKRRAAGLPAAAGHRPLADWLARFGAEELAPGGASAAQQRRVASHLRKLLVEGCGFGTCADLDAGTVRRQLDEWRSSPDRLANQTADGYARDARRFGVWLAAHPDRPVERDPFARLAGYDGQIDRPHLRRELTPEELDRLVLAAATDHAVVKRLAGPARAALYLCAAVTGLRAEELSLLTGRHFHLGGEPPTVRLAPGDTKNDKPVTIYLPPAAVGRLAAHLGGVEPGTPAWPGRWWQRAAELLRHDLARAGVPYTADVGDGRVGVADFHSLRGVYVSGLIRAGATVAELREMARHADPQTTLKHYARVAQADLAARAAKLRVPGSG